MSTTRSLKYYPWVSKAMMPDTERKKRIKLERDSPGTRESFLTASFLSQASFPWFSLSLPKTSRKPPPPPLPQKKTRKSLLSFFFFSKPPPASLFMHQQAWFSSSPAWPLPCPCSPSFWRKGPPFLSKKENAKKSSPSLFRAPLPPLLHKKGLQICLSSVELMSVRNVNIGVKSKCE